MGWLNILGIAVALAMDAFAVSIAAGLAIAPLTGRHVFRLAWHFGLFQFLMPVVGWSAGRSLAARIHAYDHWVAFALLTAIGGKMLYEARWGHRGQARGQAKAHPDPAGPAPARARRDPTRGWSLVVLSVATSIDALAVGVSMALLGVSIWLPSAVIGLVAAALTALGITFGARLGRRAEHIAEALGGLILIAIGARILLEGLL